MFKIDRATPVLHKTKRAIKIMAQTLNEMGRNDSFHFSREQFRDVMASKDMYCKYHPEKKFTVTNDGNGHRLWRTQ